MTRKKLKSAEDRERRKANSKAQKAEARRQTELIWKKAAEQLEARRRVQAIDREAQRIVAEAMGEPEAAGSGATRS